MKHILSHILFNVSIGSVVMMREDYHTFKKDTSTNVLPLLKYKYKPKLKRVVYINNTTLFSFNYVVEDYLGVKHTINPFSCKEVRSLPV